MYYMLAPEGQYYNYSGCGNTLNCNHPVVRRFILDCLRYWARARPCPSRRHAGSGGVVRGAWRA